MAEKVLFMARSSPGLGALPTALAGVLCARLSAVLPPRSGNAAAPATRRGPCAVAARAARSVVVELAPEHEARRRDLDLPRLAVHEAVHVVHRLARRAVELGRVGDEAGTGLPGRLQHHGRDVP